MVGMTKTLEKESEQLRGFVAELFAATDEKISRVYVQRHQYTDQDLFVLSDTTTDKSYLLSVVGEKKKVKGFRHLPSGRPIGQEEFEEILRALYRR